MMRQDKKQMRKRLLKINIHFIITFLLICSTSFLVRAQSGETTGNISFKITSLDYAYDKLIVSFFGSDYSTPGILGKTVTSKGTYTIKTARKQVELGTGPGWSFYQEDRSRHITMHIYFLITEEGRIFRKALKSPSLDIASYKPVISTWDLRSKEIPDLKTPNQAYSWLVHQKFGHTVGNKRIYRHPRKISDSISVNNGREPFVLTGGPGWLFFVDYWPRETRGQDDYLFVLVTESGQFVTKWASSPPTGLSEYIELTEPIPATPLRIPSESKLGKSIPAVKSMAAESPNNRWAVIISGGARQAINFPRYWNDCSFFYETLKDHGFLDDHIYVLMSDGIDPADDQSNNTSSPLDLDGDGDDDIQYSAEAVNITTVFNELQTKLDGDDILYIFTTDHGYSSWVDIPDCQFDIPTAQLSLWNQTNISDVDFALEINKVTTLATVCIFEQCYSGGMLDELMGTNRVLMSGARFWETSKQGTVSPTPEACADYDEYAYHMIDALSDPSLADQDEDGVVSMEEAHFNAMTNKHKESEDLLPSSTYPCLYNPGEHPSYYSNPWDLGRKISLNGLDSCKAPPLMGSYIQEEVSEPFPTGGEAQDWHGDDSTWLYHLPFSFPFYGVDYTRIYIELNGIIYFSYRSADGENSVDKLETRLAIAPLWDDLLTTEPGDNIFIDWTDPWLTIRWQAHTATDVTPRPVNFAVKLNTNGKIRFLYGAGNRHTTLIEQRDKTIGLSKGDGTDLILCLRNGAPDLGFAESIEFTPYEFVFVDGTWGGPQSGTRVNPFRSVRDGYNAIDNWGTLFIKRGSYNTSNDVPITMAKDIQIINYEGVVTIGD